MDESITRYRDAVAAYDAAQVKASALAKELSKVSSSMNYNLAEFLVANYGLPQRAVGPQNVRQHTYNMNEWPGPDVVNQTFQELATTFMNMRLAWEQVPQSERGFLKVPPGRPETK